MQQSQEVSKLKLLTGEDKLHPGDPTTPFPRPDRTPFGQDGDDGTTPFATCGPGMMLATLHSPLTLSIPPLLLPGLAEFYIELKFEGTWTTERQAVFQLAADR